MDEGEIPKDFEEELFAGLESSNLRLSPIQTADLKEIARVNSRSKLQGTKGIYDVGDEIDEEHQEFVDDDTSGLEDSESEIEDDKFTSNEELSSKIDSRLGELLKDRKVTNPKQKNLVSELIADLSDENQEIIVAMGGKGAKGNQVYHWRASKTPSIGDKLKGGKGEEISLELEMKMLANVGLVGYPNAGKSTLLRAISRATPKVAGYPFTTLRPRVGMVDYEDYRQISVADLPGIIEGAHKNRGLGFTFLRHIERTNILCFVVSLSQLSGEPIKHFKSLLEELEHYQPGITTAKKSILVANKIDLGGIANENFEELRQFVDENQGVACPRMPVIAVSAKEGDNIHPFLKNLYEFMFIDDKKLIE